MEKRDQDKGDENLRQMEILKGHTYGVREREGESE